MFIESRVPLEKLSQKATTNSASFIISVFLKNPNILAVNDLKPSPDAKDPFLLPPEMMFYVYDRNPFQLSTQKRDAYLGDLLDHIATLKIKTIITSIIYKL